MKARTMLLLFICLSTYGHARQERDTVYTMSPIIVTATAARERETPVTFSNLSGMEIQERYSMQDIPVLLSELPSVTSYSENGNGIGYSYINLRGFDQRRLSVMINGVPQNDPEDHQVYWIDVPDLMASTGDVQMQRGAGNAFYGPPAIGGSVNLVTNPFRTRPGITLESMLGFQEFGGGSGAPGAIVLNTRKYGVAISSGQVNDQYMFYGRLSRIQSDGYRMNSDVDMDSYFLGALRFDRNMTTRLHFYGGPLEDGLAYTGLPKFVNDDPVLRRQNIADGWSVDSTGHAYDYAMARRAQEREHFSQPHYELIHDWTLTPSMILHTTLFYYTGDGYYDYDASWADTSMLRIGSAFGIPTAQNPTGTLVRAFVGNTQWGWLPRIEINHGDGSMTLGAEARIHRSTHWGRIQFAEGLPANFDPDYHFYEYNGEKDILSVYVHELFHVSDRLSLLGDLQLVRNRYGIKNDKFLGNDFSLSYFFANPRAGLNYNIDESWNGYVSLAYTSREPRLAQLYAAEFSYAGEMPQFRAGTTNGGVAYDFSDPYAKPERLFDVEFGAKYRGAQARFSADVYWMEFTDEIVKLGTVDLFGQAITGNAPRSRHIGLEVDGAVTLIDGLTVSGNATISRNRLVRYRVMVNGTDVNLARNPIAGFPDVLGNLRLTWRNDTFTAALLAKYVGAFYTDNFKNENNRNDPYAVLNAEALYTLLQHSGVELTLRGEVRNVFNNLYFASGEGNAFFPAAERNYLLGLTVGM